MTPYRIQTIIAQCGKGIRGAFAYTGARGLCYQDKGNQNSIVTERGCVDFGCGITFKVNGKRGQNWIMIVTLEPNDTYTVRLWRRASKKLQAQGQVGEIIGSMEDVYADDLQTVIEAMYDRAIKEFNKGFINL